MAGDGTGGAGQALRTLAPREKMPEAAPAVPDAMFATQKPLGNVTQEASQFGAGPGGAGTPGIAAYLAVGLGVALVAWAVLQARRASTRRAAHTAVAQANVSSSQVADMRQLHADMAELGRALAEQLDERAKRLDELLARADQRIEALRAAQADVRAMSRTAGDGGSPSIRAGDSDDRVVEAKVAPRRDARLMTPPPSSHATIHALADEGLSPVEIAQRTGTPTGQVELVLNLRKAGVLGA